MITSGIYEEYQEQGYAVRKGVVPEREIRALRAAAAGIVDAFDVESHKSVFSTRDGEQGRDRYFMDSAEAVHCFLEEDALDNDGRLTRPKAAAVNKIGHALHDRVPEFTNFCRLPFFAGILQAIAYEAPVLWQTMYIFKQPRIGGEVRWHQDASYLLTRPNSVVGFWLALEDAHRDNGCLWVQPGGHRSPLRERYRVDHSTGKAGTDQLDNSPWPAEEEAVPVEVPAGSLVIFHDHLPHYSAQNRSELSREAFTMHFAEAASDWSERNWLQRPKLAPFLV